MLIVFPVIQVGEKIVEGLQGILEGTETPEVMVATVDVLRELNLTHSHILNKYFQVSWLSVMYKQKMCGPECLCFRIYEYKGIAISISC